MSVEHLGEVHIGGFRGFAGSETLHCAVPDGRLGSGLTILVGPNNAGKSAVLEAIKLAGTNQQPEIGRGVRNVPYGDRTVLRYELMGGRSVELRSVEPGSYLTEWTPAGASPLKGRVYTVPARRSVSAHFGRAIWSRAAYAAEAAVLTPDRNTNPALNNRLIQIVENRAEKALFDDVVQTLLGHELKWELDRLENGDYVFAIDGPTGNHTSDGLGFGILSVFYIVAGLFDADQNTVVAIDEPELSMHPQIQRRVAEYLAEQSSQRQIIMATHSPYFVDPSWFANGTEISRCYVREEACRIARLTRETKQSIEGLTKDLNNPHVLGLDAREVFFAEEGVLVVEGQEDVMLLRQIAARHDLPLPPSFFGWGAGGAEKVRLILAVLRDLGFEKVSSLLDADKTETSESLKVSFPAYRHFVLPADDIRDKPEQHRSAKSGVCSNNGRLKDEFVEPISIMLRQIAAETEPD